jgi:Xaa-Pro aminopeptidase
VTRETSSPVAAADENQARRLFDGARRSRDGLCNEARLRQEIAAAGFDAVVAASQANVIYTSGAYLAIDVVPTFIVTTGAGERSAIVNEADADFVRAYSALTDVRAYRFSADSESGAIALLGELLDELGLAHGRLGVELGALSMSRFQRLSERCPHVEWRDAEPVFQSARLVKTPAELDLLRAAAVATAQAIDSAFADADSTTTEKDLAARIQANALDAGADELSHANINAGAHSTLGHSVSLEAVIAAQEVVHVDFGAKWAGYTSDVSRNAVMAEPTANQRDIYDRLFTIHRKLLSWVGPGITAGEVFDRGQEEFAEAGLTYPWGTLGHSIGLAMHEGFELAAGSDVVLEPGMVVCIEPSHIEPGDARYDVEDMVAIREDGIEILSRSSDISALPEIR